MKSSTVSKQTTAKKILNQDIQPAKIHRMCKIVDAYMIEHISEESIDLILFILLEDSKTKDILKTSLSTEELDQLGISLNSKSLIDLCSWLKTFDGFIELYIDELSNTVTLNELLSSTDLNKSEDTIEEKHIDAPKEPDAEVVSKSFSVRAVRKFGGKSFNGDS